MATDTVDLEIDVQPRNIKPVTFRIKGGEDPVTGVNHKYTFLPPKVAPIILDMYDSPDDMVRILFDWLGEGMSEEDNNILLGRLRDKEDDFEIYALRQLLDGIIAKVSGRPTT